MLNIVLTGASGYVGRAIIRALEQLPEGEVAVKALVRRPELFKAPAFVEVIEGSLPEVPDELFFDAPHVLIHFGVKQIDTDGSGFHDTNVLGTHNLMEKCNEHTLGTIYGSTLSVQGQQAQANISESEIIQPQTELARSRAQAEHFVTSHMDAAGQWAFNLRPRFILGVDDQYVLPGLIKLAANGIYIGSGEQSYSVISVDDYAAIIIKLVLLIWEGRGRVGHAFKAPQQMALNVGYKEPLSYDEIFTEIRDHLDARNRVLPVRFPKWLPGILRWAPNAFIESKATQLQLIGFDHYSDVSRLEQLIGIDITQQNSIYKLRELLDLMAE